MCNKLCSEDKWVWLGNTLLQFRSAQGRNRKCQWKCQRVEFFVWKMTNFSPGGGSLMRS